MKERNDRGRKGRSMGGKTGGKRKEKQFDSENVETSAWRMRRLRGTFLPAREGRKWVKMA